MAPIGYGHKNEGYTDWIFCHSSGSPDIVILSGFSIGSDQPASDRLDCKDHSKLVVASCRLNFVHVANLFPFPINSHTPSEYVPKPLQETFFLPVYLSGPASLRPFHSKQSLRSIVTLYRLRTHFLLVRRSCCCFHRSGITINGAIVRKYSRFVPASRYKLY